MKNYVVGLSLVVIGSMAQAEGLMRSLLGAGAHLMDQRSSYVGGSVDIRSQDFAQRLLALSQQLPSPQASMALEDEYFNYHYPLDAKELEALIVATPREQLSPLLQLVQDYLGRVAVALATTPPPAKRFQWPEHPHRQRELDRFTMVASPLGQLFAHHEPQVVEEFFVRMILHKGYLGSPDHVADFERGWPRDIEVRWAIDFLGLVMIESNPLLVTKIMNRLFEFINSNEFVENIRRASHRFDHFLRLCEGVADSNAGLQELRPFYQAYLDTMALFRNHQRRWQRNGRVAVDKLEIKMLTLWQSARHQEGPAPLIDPEVIAAHLRWQKSLSGRLAQAFPEIFPGAPRFQCTMFGGKP